MGLNKNYAEMWDSIEFLLSGSLLIDDISKFKKEVDQLEEEVKRLQKENLILLGDVRPDDCV